MNLMFMKIKIKFENENEKSISHSVSFVNGVSILIFILTVGFKLDLKILTDLNLHKNMKERNEISI